MQVTRVFLLLVLGAVLVSSQSHNTSFGQSQPSDRLLYRGIVRESSKFLRKVTKDVDFHTDNWAGQIRYIRITDQYVDGNGGYATLLSGGPGQTSVRIHLKSKRNHGFNFIVEIYGK